MRLASLHHRRQHVGAGRVAAHDLEQLHHVGRAEEVHADDVLRAARAGGDPVDVERRRVRREDRAGLGDVVQCREHLLLDGHVLEHRLDDEVRVAEIVVVERRREQRHVLRDVGRARAALFRRALVVGADLRHAPVERAGIDLEQRDRNARRQEVHRDAAAHRAGADDRDALDRAHGVVSAHAGNARRRALGEERVAQRTRFRASAMQLQEQPPLVAQPLVERHRDRGRDRVDAFARRRIVLAPSRRRCCARTGSRRRRSDSRSRHRADRLRVQSFGDDLARECQRGRRAHRVSTTASRSAVSGELRGGDAALAGHDHVERRLDADRARQPLRAAGARQQAELHLGQRQRGRGARDAVVASERQLQPAAHADAVDRRDHRLGAVFGDADHRMQRGLGARLRRVELADVGAAGERLALRR